VSRRVSTRIAGWSCSLSAEPVPSPPEAARSIFGPSLPVALAYAELLAGPGVVRGLIGPDEPGRLWDRHLLNSAVVAELVPSDARLIDLGSGAGLPGIVLAILLPESEVTLVEPMERRTTFLEECLDELGLRNVQVVRGRAEDLVGKLAADVVTARAVAKLSRLATLAAGLARPGGLVLAIKGASAEREVEAARPVLSRLGVRELEIIEAGIGLVSQPATVVRFRVRGGRDNDLRPR
jgi:16S rRNA (guanine527-N7)-methyltransferase